MLDPVDSEFDPVRRAALTQQAMRRVAAQDPLLPIFHIGVPWGLRRGLTMTPRGDQYTMAISIRPAP